MTALYFPSASGQYTRAVQGLYCTDASGTYRSVKNAWVTDASGQYRKCWPYLTSINSFTVKRVASGSGQPWVEYQADWNVSNSNDVRLYLAGSNQVIYQSGAISGFRGQMRIPGQTVTFLLRAFNADGSYVDSAPVPFTFDKLPAPSAFALVGLRSNAATYAFNSPTAVDSVEIVDTLAPGTPVKVSVGATGQPTALESGLLPSTTYERAIRSRIGSTYSSVSNKVRFTTPKPEGTPAGRYDFPATYAETWSPLNQQWRGVAAGTVHGDGDNWAGTDFGYQVAMFFYDLSSIRALSGRVTRFAIRMKRDGVSGYSSPQVNHFIAHTAATRPAGNPANFLGYGVDVGSLAWNDNVVFDLPVALGQSMVDNAGVNGIAWGYVPARYMRGPALSAYPLQGCLSIFIG